MDTKVYPLYSTVKANDVKGALSNDNFENLALNSGKVPIL